MELQRLGMAQRYSEAAIYNGVAYLAGQVPETTFDDDIIAQTREVLGKGIEQGGAKHVAGDAADRIEVQM